MDYDQFHQHVRSRYERLPAQLQRIAGYLLDHSDDAALATVAEVAARVEVQPSSVIRFAKAVGFSGFSEIQEILRTRLRQSLPRYRDRIRTSPKPGDSDGTSLLRLHAQEDQEALTALQAGELGEHLDRAAMALARAHIAYVVATGRAMPVANYLWYAISRLERRCVLIDSTRPTDAQQAMLATSADLVIVTSFHPYSPATMELVRGLDARGMSLIGITDSIASPLANIAGVRLVYSETGSQPFRSLTVPLALARTLVVATAHRLERKRRG